MICMICMAVVQPLVQQENYPALHIIFLENLTTNDDNNITSSRAEYYAWDIYVFAEARWGRVAVGVIVFTLDIKTSSVECYVFCCCCVSCLYAEFHIQLAYIFLRNKHTHTYTLKLPSILLPLSMRTHKTQTFTITAREQTCACARAIVRRLRRLSRCLNACVQHNIYIDCFLALCVNAAGMCAPNTGDFNTARVREILRRQRAPCIEDHLCEFARAPCTISNTRNTTPKFNRTQHNTAVVTHERVVC